MDENFLSGHHSNVATAATQMMDMSLFTETSTETDEQKINFDEKLKEDDISLTIVNIERQFGSTDKNPTSPGSDRTYTSDHLPAIANTAPFREIEPTIDKSFDKAGNWSRYIIVPLIVVSFVMELDDDSASVSSNESVNIFAVPVGDTLIDEEPFNVAEITVEG